jgi:hypothetical protein
MIKPMFKSKPYTDDDLPHIQAALARWIQTAGACGYYHVGDIPHRIYETLRGRYPVGELVRIWEEGTNIAGIVINFLFDTSFQMFVSPSCRGTDSEYDAAGGLCDDVSLSPGVWAGRYAG